MNDAAARAHIRVSGRVQGVFYRASTAEQARELGLNGWVRNLPDGRVEAVFEGDRTQVEAAVAWCRHGPSGARVSDLELHWEDPQGDSEFRIAW